METLNFRSKHLYSSSTLGIELPITISVDAGHAVTLVAKVDTGAMSCIFQREHADALGLQVENDMPKKFSTAAGVFWTYGHTVKLSCFDYEFESMVYFASQYDFPRNVLGLQGWLDKLRFGLLHHDESVFLSYYDE
ncbi:MAG: retropepsin-like domain-containing protein [Acidobacteriota bacterium]|nr:retropepsin-like domain-containing protein [Acidobacteriota bacterium]